MSARDDHERRLAELFKSLPVALYRESLAAMLNPAFGIDGQRRTVLVGLSAEETYQLFRLHELIYGHRDRTDEEEQYYWKLRAKFDAALQQNWEAYQRQRVEGSPKQ